MIGTKTGGRKAGTPNKITSELRDSLKAILDGELLTLTASLDKLTPKERLDVVLRLMPYCMPKVETINGQYDLTLGDIW